MHKPALIAAVLMVGCIGPISIGEDEEGESSDMSSKHMRTFIDRNGKSGWADTIVPSGIAFTPGAEKKFLSIPGDNKTSQWYTVYIAVKAVRFNVGGGVFQYVPAGPIVGHLHMGTDGGDADIEFDVDCPRSLAQSTGQAQSVSTSSGAETTREAVTVISFEAANFELSVRHDGNNRTILPMLTATPGNHQQEPAVFPTPVPVSVWAAYGARKTSLYRRIIVSNGDAITGIALSQHTPGAAGVAFFPVPTAAKRFRVYRVAFQAGPVIAPTSTPPMQVELQTASEIGFASVVYNIPVNDQDFREIPVGSEIIRVTNNGADNIFSESVEFELEL